MLEEIRATLKCGKGFTLMELMVVVAIIAVLATIVIPRFLNATDDATAAKIQADLRSIDSAITMYYAANNAFPADIATLVTSRALTVTPIAPSAAWLATGTTGYTINAETNRAQIALQGGNVTSDNTQAQIKAMKTATTSTIP